MVIYYFWFEALLQRILKNYGLREAYFYVNFVTISTRFEKKYVNWLQLHVLIYKHDVKKDT